MIEEKKHHDIGRVPMKVFIMEMKVDYDKRHALS